jgi:hypothetical protein
MKTEQEIYQMINEIKATHEELGEKAPKSQTVMKESMRGELIALYWVLGHSRRSAMDSASIALGGDPIDWS